MKYNVDAIRTDMYHKRCRDIKTIELASQRSPAAGFWDRLRG